MFRIHVAGLVLISVAALLPGARAQTGKWEPIGLSGGGAMYTPAISGANPKRMMLNCDMSGVYVSQDGGDDWQMINHLQLRSNTRCRPAFHPTDPRTIYAANGWAGMAVSHDGGEHWKPVPNLEGNLVGDIAIDEGRPQNMMTGTEGHILRSQDEGQTWAVCSGPTGTYLSAHYDQTSPVTNRTCFVATTKGIWRSNDGGFSWEKRTTYLPEEAILSFSGGSDRKSGRVVLYCSVPSHESSGRFTGGVYRSFDKGTTWQPAMGAGINTETKAFDPWSMGPIAQYAHVVTTDADPNRVYACNSNTGVPPPHHATVFRSDDAGESWHSVFQADPRFPGLNVAKDYVVTVDGQFYQDVADIAVSGSDPDHIVMVNGGCLYATSNGGKDWTCGHTRPAPETAGEGPMWFCTGLVVTSTWNYYVDPLSPTMHYICYTDIGFARSFDRGRSWSWWAPKGRAPWTNTCYQLAFDPSVRGRIWGAFSEIHDIGNGNIVWGSHSAHGKGGICVSDDHGATWKVSNQGLPLAPATSVVVDANSPAERRILYAGMFGEGVYRSDNGGSTWMAKNEGLGSPTNRRVTRVVMALDGTLFATISANFSNGKFQDDGAGIYRSIDRGEHWLCISRSQSFLWPKDLNVDPRDSRILYVGAADARADQAGLWRTKDGGAHWARILKQGPEHFGAYLSPTHPGWIYATLTEGAPKEGLWLSKDDGETWKPISGLPFSNAQRVAFDPTNTDAIYVTTFGGSVWRGPAE